MGPAWCQHKPGPSDTPLCQGMSWVGISVVMPCWNPRVLRVSWWEGYEEGVSSDQCGLEGTGIGGL